MIFLNIQENMTEYMISGPIIYLNNSLDSGESLINAAYISISWTYMQEHLDILKDQPTVCHLEGKLQSH